MGSPIGVDLAGSAKDGSVPNRVGYGEGCPHSNSDQSVWGSVLNSHSGVRDRAPAESGFWRILKATKRSFLYLYDKNLRRTICISVPLLQILGGGLVPRVPLVIYAHGLTQYACWKKRGCLRTLRCRQFAVPVDVYFLYISHCSNVFAVNVADRQMFVVGRNSTTLRRRLSGSQGHVLRSANFRLPLSTPDVTPDVVVSVYVIGFPSLSLLTLVPKIAKTLGLGMLNRKMGRCCK